MSEFPRTLLRKRNWSIAACVLAVTAVAAFAADAPQSRRGAGQSQVHYLEQKAAVRGVQVAQLFGESDEEKAARKAYEDNQDAQIARLNQRVDDLENSLRRLTGQIEELDHRLDQVNQHMTQMQKDFDYKICALSAQQLGATTDAGDPNALACGGQASSAPPPSQNSADTGPIHLTPPPGVLGSIPAGSAVPGPSSLNSAGPSPATRKKFDAAMNLLAKAQYDEAAGAFRSFADTYPTDDLAPQAVYWVGDIAYVQKDYANAARAFAEGIKKYPTSPRGPDSMLKLGQSLLAMDQKKEGCTTLAAIPGKYPTAKVVIDQAKAARKEAACTK